MPESNPFSLNFGRIPKQYIQRPDIMEEICSEFCAEEPSRYCFMLTGIRGSGKTVLLYNLFSYFSEKDDWLAVSANPEGNIEEEVASKLYESVHAKDFFDDKALGVSFRGLSVSISEKNGRIQNSEAMLERLVEGCNKKGKRILIVLDEASNKENLRHFAHTFQDLQGKGYDVFLLMTGLYETIYKLQNEKTMTFLYRCPRVELQPLSLSAVMDSYRSILSLPLETAGKAAKMTKGYAFGYQLLGYELFKHKGEGLDEAVVASFDEALAVYAYDKVYEGLTKNERKILQVVPEEGSITTQECAQKAGLSDKSFSVHRNHLVKGGVLEPTRHGYVSFALPRFGAYIANRTFLDSLD